MWTHYSTFFFRYHSLYVVLLNVWYSSQHCDKQLEEGLDDVSDYSLRLVWDGLMQMSRNDMVREGDRRGAYFHTHYRLIGHHFLVCKFYLC